MNLNVLVPRQTTFEALALPYLDVLYHAALHLTLNRRDAEELVTDTFVQAFQSDRMSFSARGLKLQMFKILYDLFVSGWRDWIDVRAHTGSQPSPPPCAPGDSPANGDMSEGMVAQLFDDEINRALAKISEEHRSPILLVDLLGFSYHEAASILACTVRTLTFRLGQGRRRLRELLSRMGTTR